MPSFKTRAIFYCILGSLIVNSMSKVSATGFKLFIVGETEDTIMCRFDECENPFESKPRAHETSPLSSELQSTKINTQIVLEAYGSFIEVAFVFLNILFGIVLDMKKVKPMLKTPVGPGITFFADFILAPLVSHGFCGVNNLIFYIVCGSRKKNELKFDLFVYFQVVLRDLFDTV